MVTRREIVRELRDVIWGKKWGAEDDVNNSTVREKKIWLQATGGTIDTEQFKAHIVAKYTNCFLDKGERNPIRNWRLKIVVFFIDLLPKKQKEYLSHYALRAFDVLRDCIELGYIVQNYSGIRVGVKGKDFIKPSRSLELFFDNAYVKAIIISAFSVFVTWYITENILNKISDVVVKNNTPTQQSSTSTSQNYQTTERVTSVN